MTRVHQVLVGAAAGDAVTGAALEIDALLAEGHRGGIYARYFDPSMSDLVSPLASLPLSPGSREDVILLHVSIGEPDVTTWLADRPERLVVYYHNISPAAAFRPYDAHFAGLLRHGRQQLGELAKRAEMTLAVSQYNAAELVALGATDVRVSPLVYDPTRLLGIDPHPPTVRHLSEAVEGPVVLFVGQLLPHKRPELLLEAYYVLATYLRPGAHLIMVGAARLDAYAEALRAFVQELNLDDCWMTGHVSDAELAAFYRRADVFVTASDHEGFCAPLLEAMAFEVPVVARACAAIPETLGDAGVLLAADDGAEVMAEATLRTLADTALARRLVERGRARVARYGVEAARRTLLDNLEEVLG